MIYLFLENILFLIILEIKSNMWDLQKQLIC